VIAVLVVVDGGLRTVGRAITGGAVASKVELSTACSQGQKMDRRSTARGHNTKVSLRGSAGNEGGESSDVLHLEIVGATVGSLENRKIGREESLECV
jgi:hypothetical protein